MKKIFISLLLTTLLLSCTTLKDPSKENVGMLLIPHKAKIDSLDANKGNYIYIFETIDGKSKRKFIIPAADGTGKLYLEPGDYYISGIDFVTKSGVLTDFEVIEINDFPFTVTNGEISVLPFTLISIFGEKSPGRYTLDLDIYEATNTEYNAAINSLNDFEGLENWVIN